ncbi:hypothetical protein MMC11_006044 [Xylographa trunciseda]|nr:hypothetical protein [Xylographa trunciseda]
MDEIGEILAVQLTLVIFAMTAGFIRLYRVHTQKQWSLSWSISMLILAMTLLFAHLIMTLVYLETYTAAVVIPKAVVDTVAILAIQISVLSYFLKLLPSPSIRGWLMFLIFYWFMFCPLWLCYLTVWFIVCSPLRNQCDLTGRSMLALACLRTFAYIILFIAARSVALKSQNFVRPKTTTFLASMFCFIPCACILTRGIFLFVDSSIDWWIRLDDLEVTEMATAIFFASLLQLEPLVDKLSVDPVEATDGPTMVAPPPYTGKGYTQNNSDGVQPQSTVQPVPAVEPQPAVMRSYVPQQTLPTWTCNLPRMVNGM